MTEGRGAASLQHRREAIILRRHLIGKPRGARRAAVDRQHRRTARNTGKLGLVGAVGHNEPGLAAAPCCHPAFNRRRTKSGEQRLVDCPRPPGAKRHRQQFRNARQEARDHIARANATGAQETGEARRAGLEVAEADGLPGEIPANPLKGNAVAIGPAVAAFDAGIDAGRKIALKHLPRQRIKRKFAQGCLMTPHAVVSLCPWRTELQGPGQMAIGFRGGVAGLES